MTSKYQHIDLAYLEDVSSGDVETKKQLIALFFEQMADVKSGFASALANNDTNEMRKIAHLAKSSTKIMGINDLSAKMQEFEQSLKTNAGNTDCSYYTQYFFDNIGGAIDELNTEMAAL